VIAQAEEPQIGRRAELEASRGPSQTRRGAAQTFVVLKAGLVGGMFGSPGSMTAVSPVNQSSG